VSNITVDNTPIPAGSWVVICYAQNTLGALDVTVSARDLLVEWAGYLPTPWPQKQLALAVDFTEHHAALQVQIPTSTNVGEVASLLGDISPKVDVLSVRVFGPSPASDADINSVLATCGGSILDTVKDCIGDPLSCLPAGSSEIGLLILLLIAGYFLLSTGTGKRLLAKV
jgi:hypothetical protein